MTVKRIKLAEIIDVDTVDIGRRASTRVHYWNYPIKFHAPRFINTISLPDYTSLVKIERNSPPTELVVEFMGTSEINENSRPTNVLRRRNRTPLPILNIGFNHIQLAFLAVVESVEPNPFVYYKDSY